jgi:hypothetical protein
VTPTPPPGYVVAPPPPPPGYGAEPPPPPPAAANVSATDYCAQRYKSYDPATGTYLGFDGQRHPCP